MNKKTKRCGHCKKTKPIADFTTDPRTKDGYYGWCQPCRRVAHSPVVLNISPTDLHWVAGILEGEGSFSIARCNRGRFGVYEYGTIKLGMTDEDVVRRVHSVIGTGSFYGPYRHGKASHKPRWVWELHKFREIIALLTLIEPLMGARRQKQIHKLVALTKNRIAHMDRRVIR